MQDIEGIGEAIVSEADRLIAHDTIRVYRVDHVAQTCEPVAFQGQFMGIGRPSTEMLRVRIGEGLTGWVALHNCSIRLGDAASDPRGMQVGQSRGAESMLLVPMPYESRVLGVIVVSKTGHDQFSEDDQRTVEIFAGYAAQALANAEAFGQVRRQQDELHHRLESQRRLLEVNERLLATLDPSGVLEMIADSLKAVVSYDSLTIYRVDRAAWVRRAVVARDRFADVIMSHEGPLDTGITGWAIRNAQAVLANDAHHDPRSVQIPGTPEEPESMIVCPLLVAGEVIGTLNMARMGGDEAHFSRDEFELVQLFAAQASIALRNAEAHGAVMTRAEHDSLTGLRNHGAFQQDIGEWIEDGAPFTLVMLDLDAFKAYNDTHGHPAGDALLVRIAQAMRDTIRDGDRVYRYGGDEFAILLPRVGAQEGRDIVERVRAAVARLTVDAGPLVTASVGTARFRDDACTKDALVAAADRGLYLAKPPSRSRTAAEDPTRDLYLEALDETAFKLLDRLEPNQLLLAIVERAAAMIGVPHGYLYLLEDDGHGQADLVVRVATGLFEDYEGYRLPRNTGAGWAVVRTGQPQVVDDYDGYLGRAPDLAYGRFGAVCAVPLTSGGEVLGVIGLASGDLDRPFSAREVAALARFAQLASIALDNARCSSAPSPRCGAERTPHSTTCSPASPTGPCSWPGWPSSWRPPRPDRRPGAGGSGCSCSTSTGSRSSTRASGTRQATSCWSRSGGGCGTRRARRTRSPGSAATSSGCCWARSAARARRSGSRRASSGSSPRRSGSTAAMCRWGSASGSPSAVRARRGPATCSRRRRSRSIGRRPIRSGRWSCSTPRCERRRSTARPWSTTCGGRSSATSSGCTTSPWSTSRAAPSRAPRP
jgi:diguanylate cyclase (GGDEF)-like protein